MAGELEAHSSDRNGAVVLWVTIHTAEGPTDEFPARPDLDAGSAEDLLAFFEPKTDRSVHAIADDDVLLDDLIDYARSAWTLRNGNPHSDNLEMCGLASWSRAEWLTHPGMLKNAARWVAKRCHARGITPRRLSIVDVQGRQARGYMDHNTYTKATGDGTHWDVGLGFPWDVFGQLVTAAYNGTALDTEDDLMTSPISDANLDAIAAAVWARPLQGQMSAPERAGQVLVNTRVWSALVRDQLPGVSARCVSILDGVSKLLDEPAPDVDEAQLAAQLAPLINSSTVSAISDETLQAIAKASAAELARRLGSDAPAA